MTAQLARHPRLHDTRAADARPGRIQWPRPRPLPTTLRATGLALAMVIGLALGLGTGAQPATAQGGNDLLQGFDAPLPGTTDGQDPGAGAGGDLLQGFDASLPKAPVQETDTPETPSAWSLDGFVRLDGAYNYAHEPPVQPGTTDWRGWSKLRATLRLEVSVDLSENWRAYVSGQAFRDFIYQLKGEDEYTPQMLDRYQDEGEIREAWVLGTPIPSLDVKVGRQIVVWGKSDNIRVVDVLNPIDLREPGLTDLEDLRLPVTMTRLDYYLGDWGFSAIAVHEIRFNREPVVGSDFYPLPVQVRDEVPDHGGENTEWGTSLSGIFSGWDLAFYWAEVFNDEGFIVLDPDGNPFNGLQPVRYHPRVHMGGAAVNVALGNWLLKSEAAQISGLRYASLPNKRFRRVDGLLGVEYSGISDTTIALEAAGRRVLDYDPALVDEAAETVSQYALSYRASFLRETLDVVAVISAYGASAEQGTLQRYQLTYELFPAMDVTGGVLVFTAGEGGNALLTNAKDNDRAFFEAKWSF